MGSYRLVKMLNPISITVNGTFTPKGAYNAGTSYSVGDQVDYNGTSYILYSAASAGTLPTDNTKWGVLASKGDQGIQGIPGTPGTPGADGADGADGTNGTNGLPGADGADGVDGTNGQGVPVGGTAGQQLAKINGTDYNTQWVNPVDISGKADTTTLTAHTSNTSNPHSVTKAQVGLGSVPDTDFTSAIAAKQDTLVSGTNIKTINSTSILGSGDIVVAAGSDPLKEDVANKSTTTTLGTSDTLYPSQKAVKTYVDTTTGAYVAKAGDTMTGKLTISSGGTYINGDVDLRGATGGYLNVYDIVYGNGYYSEGHVYPTLNKVYNLGTSAKYWNNSYTNRLYLNSTASLDGSTAGVAKLTGRLDIPVTTSTDGQITQGGSTILHTYTRGDGYFPNLYLGKDSGNYTSATTGATYFGTGNLALGFQCLRSITTGYYNIALGNSAGIYLTTGFNNFLAGHTAGNKLTTGSNNFLMGRETGYELTTGSNNVGIGLNVLRVITTAGNNTAVGHTAGFSATGSANIFLGYQAGYNETGSNKLYIANSSTSTPLIGGDFSANTITTPASIEITDTAKGVILKSPDGTRWRVTIDNTGALTTASI